jgi:anthranilate synthase component II
MPDRPHILFVDNFDSFTFNLVDALATLGARVDVYRNTVLAKDILDIAKGRHSKLIVLSPGPGTPEGAGSCMDIIRSASGSIPVFGVCLGHQAIIAAFGGKVGPLEELFHGKKSQIHHTDHEMFAGVPNEFDVGRYHSLGSTSVPDDLSVTASRGKIVMAVAHRKFPVYGVQFHPESLLTTHGQTILKNVLDLAITSSDAKRQS